MTSAAPLNWPLAFLLAVICCRVAKAFKYNGLDFDTTLCLDDYRLIALFTAATVLASALPHVSAGSAAVSTAVLICLVLYVDAIVFRVFTIDLTPRRLASALPGFIFGSFGEGRYATEFASSNRTFGVFMLSCGTAYSATLLPGRVDMLAASLGLIVTFTALLTVRRLDERPDLQTRIVLCGLTAASALTGVMPPAPLRVSPALAVVAFMPFAALALLSRRRHDPANTFFTDRSTFRRLIGVRSEAPACAPASTRACTLTSQSGRAHLMWVNEPAVPAPSLLHGHLAGGSVILVTLESVSRDALSRARNPTLRAPFLGEIAPASLRSDAHFCVSPNTTNAHRCLYFGRYTSRAGQSYLVPLGRAGYRSIYVCPVRTSCYGLRDLLTSAGFDVVIDYDTMTSGLTNPPGVSDGLILERGLDSVIQFAHQSSNFFVHLHTANTHLPYAVTDRARFSKRDERDAYNRYLDAIEETDWLLARWFEALAGVGLLKDAIVVITSDHGQSFGELGYRCHSSAVTKEQINVPLFVMHPALPPVSLPHSSHFDILPTILDLVGIPHEICGYGESLYGSRKELALFLYAETIRDGLPSHFGIVCGGHKVLVDSVLKRYYLMDLEDHTLALLKPEDQRLVAGLMRQVLQENGLDGYF